jgi:hypothetical protein
MVVRHKAMELSVRAFGRAQNHSRSDFFHSQRRFFAQPRRESQLFGRLFAPRRQIQFGPIASVAALRDATLSPPLA